MKKTIALAAFALVLSLPLTSSALTVTNTFLGSSTGSDNNLSVGDTITFEVSLTTVAGAAIDTLLFTLTGDAAGTLGSSLGSNWAGVDHNVTGWAWAYSGGGGKVKLGTNGRIVPTDPPLTQSIPAPAMQSYGFFGVSGKTGDGVPAVVGTVTITTNAAGQYQGGATQYPGVDGSFPVSGTGTVGGGNFTVVPEPGTALLMFLGLGGLGVMGRKSRK